MECDVSSESRDPDFTDVRKVSMFTEEQITKQLVDMKEQTDFMKRFRCALGIALREIKTLRTASEQGNQSTDDTNQQGYTSYSHQSNHTRAHQHLHNASAEVDDVKTSDAESQQSIGVQELKILKEYITKIEVEEHHKGKTNDHLIGSNSMEDIRIDSTNLIGKSIRHIERLKGTVETKNALTKKLYQQLSQARLMRVKRESKLEEKLKEIVDWKEKYEKLKRSNEKQVKISRNLRLALNAEKQKAQSSQAMALGLEETKKAFGSLKLQAGNLMQALREKDHEIMELTAKLSELENSNKSAASLSSKNSTVNEFSEAKTRDDYSTQCKNCDEKARELNSLKTRHSRLLDDYEHYRRAYPPPNSPPQRQRPQNFPQNHPYGRRRRMHASYTSPDSFRKVSRPPLRRRLNYGNHLSNASPNLRGDGNISGDTLLSPIDEYGENLEENRVDDACLLNNTSLTASQNFSEVVNYNQPMYGGDLKRSVQLSNSRSVTEHATTGESAIDSDEVSSVQHHHVDTQSGRNTNEGYIKNYNNGSASSSYMELGNNVAAPSNATMKSTAEAEPPPLQLNSFIRRQQSEKLDTTLQTPESSLPNISFVPSKSEKVRDCEPLQYGILWHPALTDKEARSSYRLENRNLEDLSLQKLTLDQKPSEIRLFGSADLTDRNATDSSSRKGKNSKSHPNCVTYKGNKIDVTDFSIHAFREILWSLDDGPDSADNFIKFLASTAKKLNASPKWAGKHSMGNPSDWLALRGLY